MTTRELIVTIANELFEYSNMALVLRCDRSLPMPGFSFIEIDHGGLMKPVVVVNPDILPPSPEIIAHVLGHEWGHHYYKHTRSTIQNNIQSQTSNPEERRIKELEADTYAAGFVKYRGYDISIIEEFMQKHPMYLEARLKILRETPAC